ncbi:MAG: DUF4914 family protein [Spirochaetales bacterium]|nr:DUF4914 family protein [Spirochaetales bacterium]
MDLHTLIKKTELNDAVIDVLKHAANVTIASNVGDLEQLACPGGADTFTVSYALPDGSMVDEADVVRLKNGISANYREAYMRRRDPDCMVVADARPSDKVRFHDKYGYNFDILKTETLSWLKSQELAVFPFIMGPEAIGADALAICPANAGFFALGLGLLQGVLDLNSLDRPFRPATVIYVAPPFRHTHFKGKQVVVHDRGEVHEIFSYNLYPGPSAKKGVYGALIEQGEREGWVTAHCSSVKVVTPYDNEVTFMHEGASGGGKSEMLQQPHRLADGQLLLGENLVTGAKRYLEIPRTCELLPVCDDMGLCHPDIQNHGGRLGLVDAERGWFIRVDHIGEYGTDPDLEHLTIHPSTSQLFLNVNAVPGGTGLIWQHIEDEPGKPCPNPRVIVSRDMIKNVIDSEVYIDIRSFGVRTPPCTRENPDYGILGLFHVLPPALAWLWRLVAPRGYANPSIVSSGEMTSEGVGSYWPFSTGKKVTQADLLLEQFLESPDTRYVLVPNQHVGAWKTGFMPQWIMRDYLARRGHARFKDDQITPARSPLLGYAIESMRLEGIMIPKWFLQVETQEEVGEEAYDIGAKKLTDFFHEQLKKFLQPQLSKTAREIIDCCLSGGSVEDYGKFIQSRDL